MSYQSLTLAVQMAFVTLVIVRLAIDLYLSRRQIRFVRAHREQVPEAFASEVPLDDHRKAADYAITKNRFGMVVDVLEALVLLGWTEAGGLDIVLQATSSRVSGALWAGAISLASVVLANSLIHLPATWYATFGIEARFGFNRTSVATFLVDRIKGLALLLVLGFPVLSVVLWLMERMGTVWWLYAWLVWTGFNLFLTWIYPTVIAPLFNKFKPLEDRELMARIEHLMTRVGFKGRSIRVMDGSRRSAHGNAYFTGFGRAKRIVFFDTLLARLSADEIEAVLAHELGHFKLRHTQWGLAAAITGAFAALAFLGWLAGEPWFYAALGVSTPSTAAALALFMMASPVFVFPLSPLFSWWSRRREFAADRFAAEHAYPPALASALVKLHRDNAATLTPDPWHSAYYDSHPDVAARVKALSRITDSD